MKSFILLILAAASFPAWATAQVTIHPAALVQLAGISSPGPDAFAPRSPVRPVHHVIHHHKIVVAVAKSSASPAPVPVVARVTPPPAAKSPAIISAPKPAPLPGPVDVKFAAGSSDLPGNAGASLQAFCKSPGIIGIAARAPGDPSDPSGAMRLSLARALAVRDTLTHCGVPSQQIIPRALGSVPTANEDVTEISSGPVK